MKIFLTRIILRLLGWRPLIMLGDTAVYQRWLWLKRYLRPGALRTFDAGCGAGAYTIYAGTLGNQAVGMSFDPDQLNKARRRASLLKPVAVEFIQGDLRELNQFADELGKFDQIICTETIEHILNDAKLVSDLSNMLNPNGVLLLTAPYKHYKPLWRDRISEVEDGWHVRWGYTHEELETLFNPHGLEITDQGFVSGYVSQKLINLQRRLGAGLDPTIAWMLVFPLRLLLVLDTLLTLLLNYPYLSVAVVAQRKNSGTQTEQTNSKTTSLE